MPAGSRVIGRSLRELSLREQNLQILAVELEEEVLPVPDPDWVFVAGAQIVIYGQVDKVEGVFAPEHLQEEHPE